MYKIFCDITEHKKNYKFKLGLEIRLSSILPWTLQLCEKTVNIWRAIIIHSLRVRLF